MALVDLRGKRPRGMLMHIDEVVHKAKKLIDRRVLERKPVLEWRFGTSITLLMDVRAHLVVSFHFKEFCHTHNYQRSSRIRYKACIAGHLVGFCKWQPHNWQTIVIGIEKQR